MFAVTIQKISSALGEEEPNMEYISCILGPSPRLEEKT